MLERSTPTSRRIVIQTRDGEDLTHLRVLRLPPFPLTNPGHFAPGVYRGDVNEDGTATITEEES